MLSLDDSDAEAQDKRKPGEAPEAEDEVELDDESLDEFISPMNEQGAAIELIHGIDEPLWTADGD